MKLWLTAQEIADEALPGLPETKRGVNIWAGRHGWLDLPAKSRPRPGAEGGGGYEYHVDLLPAWARLAYFRRHLAEEVTAPVEVEAGNATETARIALDARVVVVRMADRHHKGSGLAQQASDHLFALAYNHGSMPLPTWVKEACGSVSIRSLARWRRALKTGVADTLAVDRGAARKGTGVLDRAENGEVRALVLAALTKNPMFTAKHLRALVRDRFGDTVDVAGRPTALPPIRTFQHAIAQWRQEYRHELRRLTDPDGYKNSVRFVRAGATTADRLNEVWQIDASPADVMTTDGRQSVYLAIDVYSRRITVLVSATPRADAVGALVRKCILAWGVPERIKSDNGSDFTARWTSQLLAALGIEHETAAAFSPEQKGIVERAIGTFQRDFCRTLPGFIGHSVADRKKIEAKLAFSRRLGADEETLFGVDLSAAELAAEADVWAETIYGQAPHAGLRGATPFATAAAYAGTVRRIDDPAALDVLLARVPGKDGIRRVTRSGIRIDGTHYLISSVMPGTEVLCRMDPADLGRLFVFDIDGETFLGHAVAPELRGLDPAATIARVRAEQKAYMEDRLTPIRKAARKIKPRDVASAIRREAEGATGSLIAFPRPSIEHATPAIEAAAHAARPIEPAPLTGRAAEIHAAMVAGEEAPAPAPSTVVPMPETRGRRFARALDLTARLERGEAITNDEALWLGGYRAGPEYRAMAAIYEDFGEQALR